jgi:hypothetical protein
MGERAAIVGDLARYADDDGGFTLPIAARVISARSAPLLEPRGWPGPNPQCSSSEYYS